MTQENLEKLATVYALLDAAFSISESVKDDVRDDYNSMSNSNQLPDDVERALDACTDMEIACDEIEACRDSFELTHACLGVLAQHGNIAIYGRVLAGFGFQIAAN